MPAGEAAACLGLISDTHYPERLDALPKTVFEIFRDVDLILHAGDIGALSVLDELGSIAPVVAVHGNDERLEETQRELPYQQLITVAGQRIVLSHTHYPDLAQEMESRKNDAWGPKLDRRAAFGHRAQAGIVVYGHTHIPTDVLHQGVRLVNPGAIASGNFTVRQSRRTVALLYALRSGGSEVVHVDIDQPERPFRFTLDGAAGFDAAAGQFRTAVLDEAALALHDRLRAAARPLGAPTFDAFRDVMARACMPYWLRRAGTASVQDIIRAIEEAPDIPPDARATLRAAASTPD